MAKVAFIGLGVMGYPMAGHLAHAGHQVCVYNRTATRAEQWLSEFAGTSAATPREAAAAAELVMVCVGNDADLRGVVLGPDGAFAGMAAGAVLVDHTTASANVARELAAEAGEKILAAGGSAIDAMIAVQTVLGLVEPQSSGLGGGAFLGRVRRQEQPGLEIGEPSRHHQVIGNHRADALLCDLGKIDQGVINAGFDHNLDALLCHAKSYRE